MIIDRIAQSSGSPRPEDSMRNPREQRHIAISGSLKLAIIICITFVVGMGAFPNPFVEATSEAARHFFAIVNTSLSYFL